MNKSFQNQIISKHINSLRLAVDYWNNLHDPEHKHNHGFSTQERAVMAQEELDSFLDDTKYLSFDKLPISKSDRANYLRAYAIECYDMANDYNENPFIVMRRLRDCVEIRQELIKLYPELEIYSNRGICTRVAITVN